MGFAITPQANGVQSRIHIQFSVVVEFYRYNFVQHQKIVLERVLFSSFNLAV